MLRYKCLLFIENLTQILFQGIILQIYILMPTSDIGQKERTTTVTGVKIVVKMDIDIEYDLIVFLRHLPTCL